MLLPHCQQGAPGIFARATAKVHDIVDNAVALAYTFASPCGTNEDPVGDGRKTLLHQSNALGVVNPAGDCHESSCSLQCGGGAVQVLLNEELMQKIDRQCLMLSPAIVGGHGDIDSAKLLLFLRETQGLHQFPRSIAMEG